jgi:hypothetical protein
MRRSIRTTCVKCCSNSRNTVSIAMPRSINVECRKLASWGLLSLPIESAGNWTRSPQSWSG